LTEKETKTSIEAIRDIRIQKLTDLVDKQINPYPYSFDRTACAQELQDKYKDLVAGEETENYYTVAGRIMAMRNSGMFIDLMDSSGKIQIFLHKDNLSEEKMAILKLLDIGDIIGASGSIRRTPRGELSIKVKEFKILSKSLLPLPEKWHGLTDVETRYRQRYLDLIMNPETRETFKKRSQIIQEIREYLIKHGFLEVETPMLQTLAGGANARPFVTHHNTLEMDMFLRIAPELHLKRLMVGGLSEKIFEINRNFRNEGISPKHNPEFTMLELYQAYVDYTEMMALAENLICTVAMKVLGTLKINFQGNEIDFTPPWQRMTMFGAIKKYTGVDFSQLLTKEEAYEEAQKLCIEVDENSSWGKIIDAVFEEKVEPELIQPIHIIDYPRDISPLAKSHRENNRLVERFETRVNGWEIANAFSELTDPIDQRRRFEKQAQARLDGDDEANEIDEDYITALEYGMPPAGGLGIGIDRLVMLLTDSANIRDVIAFPTLRPKTTEKHQ
jgi:lysyl-tRNA synthetase, class II